MKRLLIFLVNILLVFSFCGCSNGKNSPENQIIKCNIPQEPSTLDPQLCDEFSANTVVINLFEGLVRMGENNEILPGVAQSWQKDDSGTVFKFKLRENACWSDDNKTPVLAQDFVFGLQRAILKETGNKNAHRLFCLKNAQKINQLGVPKETLGVTAESDYDLKIELEQPNEEFLKILALPMAMPCQKNLFQESAGQYGLEAKTTLGNGPFKFKKRYGWDHNNALNLVQNPNYQGNSKPIPAGINFIINKDSEQNVKLLSDSAVDISLTDKAQVEQARIEKLKLKSCENTLWGINFNLSNELFSNLKLRKAFLCAFNRDYILQEISKENSKYQDIVPEDMNFNGINFRSVAGSSLYLKNSENIQELLKQGQHELKVKQLPEITIICPDEPKIKAMVNNMIEQINSKWGCYINMRAMKFEDLTSKISRHDFQIAIAPIYAKNNSAFDLLNLFSFINRPLSNLNSPEFENLLNKSLIHSNQEAIKNLILAEKYLNENAIFYPLYKENQYIAYRPNISHLAFDPYNAFIDLIFVTKTK